MPPFLRLLPALLLLLAAPAHAFLRPVYEDAEVVERSTLIVVGRLKPDSIQYIRHAKDSPDAGSSHEHYATLLITQVLKGTGQEKELPIVIHYGLTPVVGGRWEHGGGLVQVPAAGAKPDPQRIQIMDTGNSTRGLPPLVPDAAKDHLWFLRQRSGRFGREPGDGKFGIVDPEDLRPLSLRGYFRAYLSDDPEAALKPFAAPAPGIAAETAAAAQHYLDHRAVQRILLDLDLTPAQRARQLLPYYLKRHTWGMADEAGQALLTCGDAAGDALRDVFTDPKHAGLRPSILRFWGRLAYRPAVPLLIDLLEKHDRFWDTQTLEPGWWNRDPSSPLTARRREVYGEIYYAVCALRQLRAPQARPALELTRKRWQAINFDNPQILEECDRALRELAQPKP